MKCYVVTQTGKKIPIELDPSDMTGHNNNVSVLSEYSVLRPVWLISIYRASDPWGSRAEYDDIEYYKLYKEPTDEIMLKIASQFDIRPNDLIDIKKVYSFDSLHDDEKLDDIKNIGGITL